MLVLTRRHGERIHIGGNIEVTVLRDRPRPCPLGHSRTRSVAVHRDEVYQEILVTNKAAATGTDAHGTSRCRSRHAKAQPPQATDPTPACRSAL